MKKIYVLVLGAVLLTFPLSVSHASQLRTPVFGNITETFIGIAQGYNGPITLTVSFVNGVIDKVNIRHRETWLGRWRIATDYLKHMETLIPQANSFAPVVDTVTRATVTQDALKAASEMVIKQVQTQIQSQP
jgi:hypothetical protein